MNDETPPADPSERPLASGLIWGVKASFLAYLSRMSDLKSSVNGAVVTAGGGFYFPLASADDYDPATGLGTLRFDGDVRFSGHHGMLFVMFAQPWVTFEAGRVTLDFVDPSSHPRLDRRLPMADLVAQEWTDHLGARAWPGLPATLREESVEIFNGVYPVGEAMESVDIRVQL